ncbi:hypothetical protein Moror_6413 [Moniliophthora roreri MCA 2997]|uniref:Uncharacterized protein n=1 Tax=Moniliophthora roreri (strain MCA 2997) TaxID=1381753 RepID=V2XTD2_MONRO|nr:hypothetical protein Moror_6413 [Moniliophthora roreri MCA 2997]
MLFCLVSLLSRYIHLPITSSKLARLPTKDRREVPGSLDLKGLKKDWHNVYSLSIQSGFSFCTVTHWVSATPDVWEPLLKSNQYNACYWHKHCYPHYNDMLYINKGIIATGDSAYHSSLPPQPPATTESQPVSEDTTQSPPAAPVTTALTGASTQPPSTTYNSPTADSDNESDSDDSSPATATPRNVPGSSKMSSGLCCGHHLCGPKAVSDVASAL